VAAPGDERPGPHLRARARQFLRGGRGTAALPADPQPASRRPEGQRWFATGTSEWCCTHATPYVPTVHLNYRYFEAGPSGGFGRRG